MAAASSLDALDALEDRVTEMMLTGAAAIEALATNRLDVDDFLGKAERYLGLVDEIEREMQAQARTIATLAASTPFAVNAYTDEKALALTAAEVALARDMVRASLDIATGAAGLPSKRPTADDGGPATG